MALSPAERQRRHRERLKEKERLAADLVDRFVRGKFSEYLESRDCINSTREIDENLASVGMAPRVPLTVDDDPEWHEHDWHVPYRGSLGRAERMVGAMIDSAKVLAGLINGFKLREIDAAIAALEAAVPADAAARRQALADAVELQAIRARLLREVRHPFAQIHVKGG